MESSRASAHWGAINCNPTGNPSRVNPQGIEIAGRPVRFAGRVNRNNSARTAVSRSPATRISLVPIGGAGIGEVGARITSTFSKAAAKSSSISRLFAAPRR